MEQCIQLGIEIPKTTWSPMSLGLSYCIFCIKNLMFPWSEILESCFIFYTTKLNQVSEIDRLQACYRAMEPLQILEWLYENLCYQRMEDHSTNVKHLLRKYENYLKDQNPQTIDDKRQAFKEITQHYGYCINKQAESSNFAQRKFTYIVVFYDEKDYKDIYNILKVEMHKDIPSNLQIIWCSMKCDEKKLKLKKQQQEKVAEGFFDNASNQMMFFTGNSNSLLFDNNNESTNDTSNIDTNINKNNDNSNNMNNNKNNNNNNEASNVSMSLFDSYNISSNLHVARANDNTSNNSNNNNSNNNSNNNFEPAITGTFDMNETRDDYGIWEHPKDTNLNLVWETSMSSIKDIKKLREIYETLMSSDALLSRNESSSMMTSNNNNTNDIQPGSIGDNPQISQRDLFGDRNSSVRRSRRGKLQRRLKDSLRDKQEEEKQSRQRKQQQRLQLRNLWMKKNNIGNIAPSSQHVIIEMWDDLNNSEESINNKFTQYCNDVLNYKSQEEIKHDIIVLASFLNDCNYIGITSTSPDKRPDDIYDTSKSWFEGDVWSNGSPDKTQLKYFMISETKCNNNNKLIRFIESKSQINWITSELPDPEWEEIESAVSKDYFINKKQFHSRLALGNKWHEAGEWVIVRKNSEVPIVALQINTQDNIYHIWCNDTESLQIDESLLKSLICVYSFKSGDIIPRQGNKSYSGHSVGMHDIWHGDQIYSAIDQIYYLIVGKDDSKEDTYIVNNPANKDVVFPMTRDYLKSCCVFSIRKKMQSSNSLDFTTLDLNEFNFIESMFLSVPVYLDALEIFLLHKCIERDLLHKKRKNRRSIRYSTVAEWEADSASFVPNILDFASHPDGYNASANYDELASDSSNGL